MASHGSRDSRRSRRSSRIGLRRHHAIAVSSTAAPPNEIRRRTKARTPLSNRAPPTSAAHAISGRPATMPIPKPSTNVAKVAACASAPNRRADLTVAPHRRNTFAGKEIRRRQGGHDGGRVLRTLSRLGDASPHTGDPVEFRGADPGPPEPQEGFAPAGQQPAQGGHERGRLRPCVGRGDHLDATEHPRTAAARTPRSPPSTTCCGTRSGRRPCDSGRPRDALSAATGWEVRAPDTTPGRPGSPIPPAPFRSRPPARRAPRAPPDPPQRGTAQRIAESATETETPRAVGRPPSGCPTRGRPAERSTHRRPRAAVRSANRGTRPPEGERCSAGRTSDAWVMAGFPTPKPPTPQ